MQTELTRRRALAGLVSAAIRPPQAGAAEPEGFILCAFSKHFQWASVPEAAQICASLGYEGLDLTVREGGHVLPERVAGDLPKAAEAVRKAGVKIPMVTAGIVDVRSPHAEAIIRTLASLGIRRYRWGGFRYRDGAGIPEQLAEFKPRVAELAAMNKQYGVCAMYHTHSGPREVGASMWDLYLLIKDLDSDAVSVNYDIGHATVEGGYGGWLHSARLLMPYTKGTAIKDFRWTRGRNGDWRPGWCPIGDGMVNFKRYFGMLKAAKFSGPVQLHFEYPELGGAESGAKTFSVPKDRLLGFFKRDLDAVKAILREA
jgi:sugar phosphate isomerase/epimerase